MFIINTHKKIPASKKLVGIIVRHNTLFTGSVKNCGYICIYDKLTLPTKPKQLTVCFLFALQT